MSTLNPLIGDPQYDSFRVAGSIPFHVNKQNRQHFYIYINSASPAIFQVGDYQTATIPHEQWVYWAWPETQPITKLMPTYDIFVSTFCTDSSFYQPGPISYPAYELYARSQQAFTATVTQAATSTTWMVLQLTNPNSNVTAIVDQIVVSGSTTPVKIELNDLLSSPDPGASAVVVPTNNRLDGIANSIIPACQVNAGTGLLAPNGSIQLSIIPNGGRTDVLNGAIRVLPKLFEGILAVYVHPNDTNNQSINITWHEEF